MSESTKLVVWTIALSLLGVVVLIADAILAA